MTYIRIWRLDDVFWILRIPTGTLNFFLIRPLSDRLSTFLSFFLKKWYTWKKMNGKIARSVVQNKSCAHTLFRNTFSSNLSNVFAQRLCSTAHDVKTWCQNMMSKHDVKNSSEVRGNNSLHDVKKSKHQRLHHHHHHHSTTDNNITHKTFYTQ